jgi:hypothetical protein
MLCKINKQHNCDMEMILLPLDLTNLRTAATIKKYIQAFIQLIYYLPILFDMDIHIYSILRYLLCIAINTHVKAARIARLDIIYIYKLLKSIMLQILVYF